MLQYDLGDATRWEFFFPNVERPLLVVPGVGEEGQAGGEEEEVSSELCVRYCNSLVPRPP